MENCILEEERSWSKSPKSNFWQQTVLVCISCSTAIPFAWKLSRSSWLSDLGYFSIYGMDGAVGKLQKGPGFSLGTERHSEVWFLLPAAFHQSSFSTPSSSHLTNPTFGIAWLRRAALLAHSRAWGAPYPSNGSCREKSYRPVHRMSLDFSVLGFGWRWLNWVWLCCVRCRRAAIQ